jgi:hypothetical protein
MMLVGISAVIGVGHQSLSSSAGPESPREEPAAAYADLPLAFTTNAGQTDERARFVAQGAGYSFFVTPDSLMLSLTNASGAPGTWSAARRVEVKR